MAQLEDIVGNNVQKLQELNAVINQLSNSYMTLVKSVGTTASEINKGVDGYTKLKVIQEQTAEQTKKLGEAEQQAEKIAKEQAASMAALEKMRAKGLEQMAKAESKEREMTEAMSLEVKSIKDAELQNKALTEARKKLNLTTEEGKKKAQEYNNTIDKNTEFIRKNSDAATKQRMNIGNYKSALDGMPGSLGKVGSSMSQLDRVMKVIATTNPFTLIMVAVTGLISLLAKLWSSTDSGGTKMKAIFEGFKAVFDVLIKRAADFAGGLVKIFSGDFRAGAEQMSSAFGGIGEQIKQASKAAHDYEMAMDAIDDLHTSFISDEAKLRKEIAELEYASQDQTKSMSERESAIKSAMEKEMQLVNFKKTESLKIYDEEIKKVAKLSGMEEDFIRGLIDLPAESVEAMRETSSEVGKFYDLYGDNIKKLEEAYAGTLVAETQFFEQGKRNISKLTGFQEQAREKREEDDKAALERSLSRSQTISQTATISAEQIITDAHIEGLQAREQATFDFTDREIKRIEEVAEEKRKISLGYVSQSQEIGQYLLDFNQSAIDAESQKLAESKAYELQVAGDNEAKREEIEKKYDKEATKLKIKQAKQNKAVAIFDSTINLAKAIIAALTIVPPASFVMAALTAVLAGVQLATIVATPIPKFSRGTKYAPDGLISVAENGKELIKTRSGQLLMASEPALLTGMKGATIYSNAETDALLKMRNVGYDSRDLKRTLETNNEKLIRTIQNKKEIHITPPRGSRITEREGAYFKRYLNGF